MSDFDDVGKFHEKFGLFNTTHNPPGPRPWNLDLLKFRLRFLYEEVEEFEDGMAYEDVAAMADALIDIVYVAMGTAHLLGLPWSRLWDEVQRANMKKVRAAADGSNSKRNNSFDVVKPEGWEPPNIAGILRQHGWDTSEE